jgi:hypothetical protein
MKLEVGYYKIKSRSRRSSDQFHYLRVFIQDKNKYIQIDDEYPQEADEEKRANSYPKYGHYTTYHRPQSLLMVPGVCEIIKREQIQVA